MPLMSQISSTSSASPYPVKQVVMISGATLTSVALAVLAVFVALYFSQTYQPSVSLYLLFGPETGGIIVGLITLALGSCMESSKRISMRPEVSHTSTNTQDRDEGKAMGATRKTTSETWEITDLFRGENQGKMAKVWAAHAFKDGAKHIFCNPLRSFLELIVNSLDASLPMEKGIGKFGMGFISIFTFLDHAETQGCSVQIVTTYLKEGMLTSYQMDLSKKNSNYAVSYTPLPPQEHTGTTIQINPRVGEFSNETLQTLLNYCQALQFYEHGHIEMIQDGMPIRIGEGKETLAWVDLKKNGLIVRDKGCGISDAIAHSTLFVPSISTKKPIASQALDDSIPLPTFTCYNGKNRKKEKTSHFLIVISGVIVIDVSFKSPFEKDLLLRMPRGTRLTLARDAIEFSEQGCETSHYLKQIIRKTIDEVLALRADGHLLLALYQGLKEWEERTPSVKATKLLPFLESTIQEAFEKDPKRIPYPLEWQKALLPLLPTYDEQIWVPFPSQLLFDDFSVCERYLEESHRPFITNALEKKGLDKGLIGGKCVLFVADHLLSQADNPVQKRVYSLGLRGILFAPCSLLKGKSEKELQFALIHRFVDEGKQIFPVVAQSPSSLPSYLSNLQSPKRFLFLTGVDHYPLDIHWANTEIDPIWRESLFATIPDTVFEDFLKNSAVFEFEKNLEKVLDTFKFYLEWGLDEGRDKAYFTCLLQSIVWCDTKEFWIINPAFVEEALACITQIHQNTLARELGDVKNKRDVFKKELEEVFFKESLYFKKISLCQAVRRLTQIQCASLISSPQGRLFTADRIFWPLPENFTSQLLEELYHALAKPFIASTSWAGFHEETWRTLESFLDYPKGELAIQKLLPLLLVREQLIRKELPFKLQQDVDVKVKRLVAAYHRYLTIKNGEFTPPYGSNIKLNIHGCLEHTKLDCTVADLVELLMSLKERPSLFEKATSLLTQEMEEWLNLEVRNKVLNRTGSLALVDILEGTGLGLLSLMKKKGLDPNYIEIIVQYVSNPLELFTITHFLIDDECLAVFLAAREIDKEKLSCILKDMIIIYVQNKIKNLQSPTNFTPFKGFALFMELDKLCEPLKEYFTHAIDTSFEVDRSFVSRLVQDDLAQAPTFTSKQIMNAAQRNDLFLKILLKGDLLEAISLFRKELEESDLQMITQAVHGSERRGTDATLIEAFQNSVDAIREYVRKNPRCGAEKTKISFDVRVVEEPGHKTPNLVLEVFDPIGMPSLKTLLADFLIPNYSEKSPLNESVGQMGNGSYQMYRDAEMVTLMTRTQEFPSKVYLLRTVPQRNHNQEVVDLIHQCIDVTQSVDPQFVGTQLRVLMRNTHPLSMTSLQLEAIAIRKDIQDTFAMANPLLEGGRKLTIELKLPKAESVTLSALDPNHPPFSLHGSPFTCYKMQAELSDGMVLTDGYPFKSLTTFLKEEKLLPAHLAADYARGWCFNIPAGFYSPVQSRTRLQLTQETRGQIQDFLLDWIYYRSFLEEEKGPSQLYYPHFKSVCHDFNQVFPGIQGQDLTQGQVKEGFLMRGDLSSMTAFFVHYQPSFMKKSFLTHIQEAYKTLVTQLEKQKQNLNDSLLGLTTEGRSSAYNQCVDDYRKSCRQTFQDWKSPFVSLSGYEGMFFTHILIPWFEKKYEKPEGWTPLMVHLIDKNPLLMKESEKKEKELHVHAVNEQLKRTSYSGWIQTASTILKLYCQGYAQSVPLAKGGGIEVALDYDPNASESASYNLHSHLISVNIAHISLSSIFALAKQVASCEPFSDNTLIAMRTGTSGILNHELEHARRGHACGTHDVHGHGLNADGEYVDFESCATSFAKKAHLCGLMEDWSQAVGQLDLPSDEDLNIIMELEKSYPSILASSVFASHP